jgi:hypothetical protein
MKIIENLRLDSYIYFSKYKYIRVLFCLNYSPHMSASLQYLRTYHTIFRATYYNLDFPIVSLIV